MTNYYEFRELRDVYLEDSFVLNISEKSKGIRFLMELVLTENHPMHSTPKPDEMYCYKNAELLFPNATEIDWIEKTLTPSIDALNEVDYGNIDALYFRNDFYHLSGDWGNLKIKSSEPQIRYI